MRGTDCRSDFASVTAELDLRRFISLGFERIEALLAALGNPERNLRAVQVVGTNGKGTTSVALSAALELAGETTGTYLSPHVVSYAERVRLRGEQVSEEAFASALGDVISVADGLGIEVTQFELLTAGALAMFRDAGVMWAVMEAGLGARYDATTVARPEAVILTNVSLDHREYLGDTVEEIATEKLASVPERGTLIVGSGDPVVTELARATASEKNSDLLLLSDEITALSNSEELKDLAPYAAMDIALGLRSAEVMLQRELDDSVLRRVTESVSGVLPGRFQTLEISGVPFVLDGGHNPDGMTSALRAVEAAYPALEIVVIFGVLQDKDIASMLDIVSERASHLVLTMPEGERAADPEAILRDHARHLRSGGQVLLRRDIGEAVTVASELCRVNGGVALVTGSLSTVAAMLKLHSGGADED